MKGRCFCGAVGYELTAPIQDVYYCHCRDCQRLSGSAFHVLGIVEQGGLNVTGEVRSYTHPTEDGAALTRHFCPVCGTPVYNHSSRFTDIHMFTIHTLEDPESVKASFEIWTRSKSRHARIKPGITGYPRGAMDGDGSG